MPVGDISVDTLKIGNIDLTDAAVCQYIGFNVFEDIFNPYGPTCEILVNDHSDSLGKNKLNGKEKIDISFSTQLGGSATFKLESFENKDLKDQSSEEKGALKSKNYEIRGVSPEYKNANARGNVQKGYNTEIGKAVEDLVKKTGFASNKPFENPDQTRGKVRHIATGHPLKIFQQLNDRAVSTQNKSSAYVLFVSDNRYKYCTIEHLCKQGPIVTLKQTTTLGTGTTEQQKQDSITSIVVSNSFYNPPKALSNIRQATYDPVTGKATYPDKKTNNSFVHLGEPVYRTIDESGVNHRHSQSATTLHDRVNNKSSTGIAEARQNRAAYMAYFAQNSAELLIPGNPKIKLGSVINIEIPNKSGKNEGQEKQFSGPVLVTSIRHIIHPMGTQPRYQMKLKVTKSGGYAEGGE